MYDFYMSGMLEYEDDLNMLICNSHYQKDDLEKINFSYSFSDFRLKVLRETYSLDKIAGNGSEFSRLIRITFWLASVLKFGNATDSKAFHALEVLQKTNHGFISNCYIAATVLTECFLSMGVKARAIRCMPIDLRFNECHCMVIAFVEKLNKFIAFDPAMGGCYFDGCGKPLGISDIRTALINNTPVVLRSVFDNDFIKNINRYLIKNIVRFQCHLNTRYGNEEESSCDTIINLNPTTIRLTNKRVQTNETLVEHIFIYNDIPFWD